MFLKSVPNDSKIIITFITCTLFSGIGLGVKKLMYDPNVISKTRTTRTMSKKDLKMWEEIICNVL